MEQFSENRGQYLYIKISGEFNMNEFEPGLPKLRKKLAEIQLSKILIDCREMHGYYSRVERYNTAAWLASVNMTCITENRPPLKVVCVLNETIFDPEKFGETVARNRGLECFHTTDYDEACRWLEITPAPVTMPLNQV